VAKRRAKPIVSASGLSAAAQRREHGRRFTPPLRLADHAPSREVDQACLECLMRLPQLPIVDAVDGVPDARVTDTIGPVNAEMARVDLAHLRRKPGRDVHAVGDVANRHVVIAQRRIERHPHRARDTAMQ
jgi:hypothetical protein